jgi:hypothetical protein
LSSSPWLGFFWGPLCDVADNCFRNVSKCLARTWKSVKSKKR